MMVMQPASHGDGDGVGAPATTDAMMTGIRKCGTSE